MSEAKTIFLYSNNNYEFAYKLKQICKNKLFILENINNFADLFFNCKGASIPLLFVDGSNLKNNREIISMLEKLTPVYFKKLVLFFVDGDEKIYNNKDVLLIKTEEDLSEKVENVLNMIEYEFLQTNELLPEENWIKIVSDYLIEKGFYLKHIGSQMVRDAIIYYYKNPASISSFSSTIYNYLATKYFTSVSNVERSINRSIKFAINNKNIIKDNVTNKEFILYSVSEIFDALRLS